MVPLTQTILAAGPYAGASLVRSRLGGETGSGQDLWGHGASAKLRLGIYGPVKTTIQNNVICIIIYIQYIYII